VTARFALLGIACVGCAAQKARAPEPMPAPEPTAAARGNTPGDTPDLVCDPSIAADEPLEAEISPKLRARSWVRSTSTELDEGWSEPFREILDVGGKRLELVARTGTNGNARLVLYEPQQVGACVVNTWSTFTAGAVAMSMAGRWVAPGSDTAVLLVKLGLVPDNRPPETRWLVLATDGLKLWPALGKTPGGIQLIAPEASFRPQGPKLYLDVRIKNTTVFVFRESGLFERLN